MYAKYITDKKIERMGRAISFGSKIYANPTREQAYAAGYKTLIVQAVPEYDESTHHPVASYTDGDVIVKQYTLIQN